MKKNLQKKIISNINKLNFKFNILKNKFNQLKFENDHLYFRTLKNISEDIEFLKIINDKHEDNINDLDKKLNLINYSVIMLSIALLLHLFSHLLG